MAHYLNRGKDSFQKSLDSLIYVDKSPLLKILNQNIKTKDKYFCLSRPRRFGKSETAQMICSYYEREELHTVLQGLQRRGFTCRY